MLVREEWRERAPHCMRRCRELVSGAPPGEPGALKRCNGKQRAPKARLAESGATAGHLARVQRGTRAHGS